MEWISNDRLLRLLLVMQSIKYFCLQTENEGCKLECFFLPFSVHMFLSQLQNNMFLFCSLNVEQDD